jgi:pyruvate kinase
MRRTKIVATIGPASRDPEVLVPDDRGRDGRRAAELLARH